MRDGYDIDIRLLRIINTHSYTGEDAAVNDIASSCPFELPKIILAVIS
jgi:hypothetical protein